MYVNCEANLFSTVLLRLLDVYAQLTLLDDTDLLNKVQIF